MSRPDIDFLDIEAIASQRPPAREWVIDQWLPRGTVTILVGSGGVGKSLLSQQICTSIAAGMDWLGKTERGFVVGLFCEDDQNEVWRRQVDICASMNSTMEGLAQYLLIEGRAGRFNTLTYFADHGCIEDSPLLMAIRKTLEELFFKGPVELLVLDNVAQMFNGGDHGENDRKKVTDFLNHLTGLAIEYGIAVLLLAHPGKAEGSEYSGSTAWDNAVRSRLFLRRESDDPNSRVILSRRKANYAARGGDIAFVWESGAFKRADGKRSFVEILAASSRVLEVQRTVLDALDWLADRKLTASHKRQASNYLPKEMRKRGIDKGFSQAELTEAMDQLIADMRIAVDADLWKDGHRNAVRGLKAAAMLREAA